MIFSKMQKQFTGRIAFSTNGDGANELSGIISEK